MEQIQTQDKVAELEARIEATTSRQRSASKEIDTLRQERAKMTLDNNVKDNKRIVCIDSEIVKLTTVIDNSPNELALLKENLLEAQQNDAQAERDNLLEKQNEVAENIESLSVKLIESLKTANDTNTLLKDALSAYNGLKEKTGQEVLTDYCDGSMDSLRLLTELCEYQMAGTHTAQAGGMVGGNNPVRL